MCKKMSYLRSKDKETGKIDIFFPLRMREVGSVG